LTLKAFGPGHRFSSSWVATQSWVAKGFGHLLASHKALFCKFL
jgi:hypothetical protein